jgi:hypothetical protein
MSAVAAGAGIMRPRTHDHVPTGNVGRGVPRAIPRNLELDETVITRLFLPFCLIKSGLTKASRAFDHRKRDPLPDLLSSLGRVDCDQLGGLLHAHLVRMPTSRPGRRADMRAASAPFTTASHEIGCIAMRFNS